MSKLCFELEKSSFNEMKELGSDYWKKILYDYNLIVIDYIELTRNEFSEISSVFGTPWTEELYKRNGESVDDNLVVNWSDKSRLGKSSLPWHQDSPTLPDCRTPIRTLYSINIPDPNSGILVYMDTVRFVESLSNEKRIELENIEVCYKHLTDSSLLYWYPLIAINMATGKKGLNLNAIDIDIDYEGLRKNKGYKQGNTHIIDARNTSTNEKVSMEYLAELMKECNEIIGNKYVHRWKEKQFMVISNLDQLHYRTEIDRSVQEERLLYRKTMAHDYQITGNKLCL